MGSSPGKGAGAGGRDLLLFSDEGVDRAEVALDHRQILLPVAGVAFLPEPEDEIAAVGPPGG